MKPILKESEMARTYFIDIQLKTPNGGRFCMEYSANEMAEMFTAEEMATLARGDTVKKNLTHYTDLQAFMDARS